MQLTTMHLKDFQTGLELALGCQLSSLEPGSSYHRLSSRMSDGQAGADIDIELLEGAVLQVAMTEWARGDSFSRSTPVSVRAQMSERGELVRGEAEEGAIEVLLDNIPHMSLG